MALRAIGQLLGEGGGLFLGMALRAFVTAIVFSPLIGIAAIVASYTDYSFDDVAATIIVSVFVIYMVSLFVVGLSKRPPPTLMAISVIGRFMQFAGTLGTNLWLGLAGMVVHLFVAAILITISYYLGIPESAWLVGAYWVVPMIIAGLIYRGHLQKRQALQWEIVG